MCTLRSAESCRMCKHSREKAHKRLESLISISDRSVKIIQPHSDTFKFCSFLTASIAGITFIFWCYSILEIHILSLFSPLRKSKNLSSQMESLHPELAHKGSAMITSDTGSCSNKEPLSLSRRHHFHSWQTWHQVTIHFLHKNIRYSPVALQFCCL